MIYFLKENWSVLALFPIAWYFELVVHELSHAFVAKFLLGYKITRIRLYPIKWGDFARCEWSYVEKDKGSVLLRKLLYIAPIISGVIIYSIACFVFCMFDISEMIPFMGMALGELLMFQHGTWFGSEECDAKMAMNQK